MQGETRETTSYNPLDRRLYSQKLVGFRRGDEIKIAFDGRQVKAFTSEPVAVALYAAGLLELGRSMKYHRPRAAYCFDGKCSSCLLRVNGEQNVKSCRKLCAPGMIAERQPVLSLMGVDPLSIVDKLFPKRFDYHGMFAGVKPAGSILKRMVRTFSTGAKLPDGDASRPQPLERIEADVAVVGAGPAGMAAAVEAAAAGVKTVLIDENQSAGGHLLHDPERALAFGLKTGEEAQAFLENAGVRVMPLTAVIACFGPRKLCLRRQDGLALMHPKAVVFATGGYDRTLLFEDNDMPGIMSGRAAMRLVNQWGVRPGSTGVLAGTAREIARAAAALDRAGVRLAAAVIEETEQSSPVANCDGLRRSGARLLFNSRLVKAYGGGSIEKIFAKPQGGPSGNEVACDFLALCAGQSPAYELPMQAGCEIAYRPDLGGFIPVADGHMRCAGDGSFAAGEVTGERDEERCFLAGRLAGASAALDVKDAPGLKSRRDELASGMQERKDG